MAHVAGTQFCPSQPVLTSIELNYAVQRTIDRILFLRICEDRAIEDYGSLRKPQDGIYRQLADRFQQADEKYNSGLFHFHREHDRLEPPDELTLSLTLDDAPLKAIQRELYYPDSPYEFSVLSADILGQVYEQFLGKVIRLTDGHRAVVEYKPEVRKAGGVYYTPTYIVKHMTTKAVGALCNDKTPKDVANLKILDPACRAPPIAAGPLPSCRPHDVGGSRLDRVRDRVRARDKRKTHLLVVDETAVGPGLCHGIPCPRCKARLIHRPISNTFDPESNSIWHTPYFGGMMPCKECRAKEREGTKGGS